MMDDMMDQPNAHNGRGETEETPSSAPLPPELETLAMRLSADGAAWQTRLPDSSRVAERIRAIPLQSPQATHEDSHETARTGGSRMSVDTNRPSNEDPSFTGWLPEPGPSRPWGRILGLVAAAVVVALLATVFTALANQRGATTGPAALPTATPAQTAPTATAATTQTPGSYPVLVYFSKQPDSYNDPNAVFPVQRVSPTSGVATYAIQQLIAGPTASERSAGYFTELTSALGGSSDCGGADFTITLNMRATHPQTDAATLRFCRPLALPGEMTDPRIKAEITKTLTQFSTITNVTILTRDGHCFGDLSGQDKCLQ